MNTYYIRPNWAWVLSNACRSVIRLTILLLFILLINFGLYGQTDNCCGSGKGDRVKVMTVKYTGQACSASSHNQGTAATCTEVAGGPNFDPQVYITVYGTTGQSILWFAGVVNLNSTYVIDSEHPPSGTSPDDKLSPNLECKIYSHQGGTLLQTVNFHISCSQPISAGDQFGSQLVESYTFRNGYDCSQTLPISLVSFAAKEMEDHTVKLDWSTVSEVNNEFFIVERSADGIYMEEIGRIRGEGNYYSGKNYVFYDRDPMPGTNYYRIKQVDIDGSYSYTYFVTVKLNSGMQDTEVILYPNPAREMIYCKMDVSDVLLEILVFDYSGRRVYYDAPMQNSRAARIEEGINISGFSPGLYVLQLIGQKQSKTLKFEVVN